MKFNKLPFIICLVLIVIMISTSVFAMETEESKDEFRVIGYYSGDLFDEPLEKI